MSKFGAKSTASEVIEGHDLSGYNVLVTGGNSGIGLETVRVLATAGATVYMTARNIEKTKPILEELCKSTGNQNIHLEQLELDSLDNVKSLVERFLAKNVPLHILINNAGIAQIENLTYSRDDIEMTFATNHVGHFALTLGLLPSLRAGAKTRNVRVINLSSCAHCISNLKEDWNFKNSAYDKNIAYGQAKTATTLFTVGFNEKFSKEGMFSNAVMPGSIKTKIMQRFIDSDPENNSKMWDSLFAPIEKTVPQGASTSVWAAVSPEMEGKGGLYLEDCSISKEAPIQEIGTKMKGHLPYIYNQTSAERLWKISEELIK